MKKLTALCIILFAFAAGPFLSSAYALAAFPDKFVGDTAIYNATAAGMKPNVLFIIDNSAAMAQPGVQSPYDHTVTYLPANPPFSSNGVYIRVTATGGTVNYNLYIADVTNGVSCATAKILLQNNGFYTGPLKKSDGSCSASQNGDYYLGNILNYMFGAQAWQAGKAYNKGDTITLTSASKGNPTYSMTCVQAGTSGATPGPVWPDPYDPAIAKPSNMLYGDWAALHQVTDGTVIWQFAEPMINMVTSALNEVIPSVRDRIRAGIMDFGSSNKGGAILTPVDRMNSLDSSGNVDTVGVAHYNDFMSKIQFLDDPNNLLNANSEPVNETLWDANVYYLGKNNSTTLKIATERTSYPSPITGTCQYSFIVVVTNGNKDDNSQTKAYLGDLTGDGNIGYVDDAAKKLYQTDYYGTVADGIQNVQTFVIQLLSAQEASLMRAAAFGVGSSLTDAQIAGPPALTAQDIRNMGMYYFNVWSRADLIDALTQLMDNVVQSCTTSFVAPVVPVSPENRSVSGNRIYMGYFKPISQKYWRGNVKKYGIDDSGNVVDKDGNLATYEDMDGNGYDDRDNALLQQGYVNGSFRPTSKSFWFSGQCKDPSGNNLSQTGDGALVDCGGVGDVLKARTAPRKVYTFLTNDTVPRNIGLTLPTVSGSQDLTAGVNSFSVDNTSLTPEMLNFWSQTEVDSMYPIYQPDYSPQFVAGIPTNARQNLINFILGYDSYDENGNGNYTEKRYWELGDVLHSRPQIVSYSPYTSDQENDCTKNKSILFVGANDGMLHAFRDCDGSEAWAFIPTDLLKNLRQLQGKLHVNYVDSSTSVFVWDDNKDGIIDTSASSKDRVIVMFGERRGGGLHNQQAMGWYYVLDATNPDAPRFLGRFSYGLNSNTSMSEIGETWSEPKMGLVNLGTVDVPDKWIVAFIGGGYDNCNEDSRYGATQKYIGACADTSTNDSGVQTSSSSASGSPVNPRGRGVFVLKVAHLLSGGGVAAGTGITGQYLWGYTVATVTPNIMNFSLPTELAILDVDSDTYVDRFYAGDTGGNIWRFDIKSSSPSDWKGTWIFKANPNPLAAADTGRKIFYKPSVVLELDKAMIYFGTGDREHPLNRAVTDRMYAFYDRDGADYSSGPRTEADLVDVTVDQPQAGTNQLIIDDTLSKLQNMEGWFIKLDGGDRGVTNPGEKVLASPVVINHVAYFTTYTPNATPPTNPCDGNLGTGRIYALNYKTGEAVLNYDKSNDSQYSSLTWNERAAPAKDQVLLRSDRVQTIGQGIPSGLSGGRFIGCGGGICTPKVITSVPVGTLFWRQR